MKKVVMSTDSPMWDEWYETNAMGWHLRDIAASWTLTSDDEFFAFNPSDWGFWTITRKRFSQTMDAHDEWVKESLVLKFAN